MRGLMADNFVSGYRNVGLERRCLSEKVFKDRWMHVARVLRVKGSTWICQESYYEYQRWKGFRRVGAKLKITTEVDSLN